MARARCAGSARRRRARSAQAALAILVALLCSCAPVRAEPVTVGGKDFTEQVLVAEMTARLLEARGFAVKKRVRFKTEALRKALEDGRVDLYWEYTGTSLIVFNGVSETLDPAAGYERVRVLDAGRGLVWLRPSRVNNTFAIAMRARAAEQLGIRSISDLGDRIREGADFKFGATEEFALRADGLAPLERAYGFEVGGWNVEPMEAGRVYRELRDSILDFGLVFSTDGRVAAFGFRLLADDKGYFPNYVMAPVVRKELLAREPGLAEALDALSARLDDATMARLNAEVDVARRSVEAVAVEFLKQAGLI